MYNKGLFMLKFTKNSPCPENTIKNITCQLENAILDGTFTIGERLPSERTLQKEFQVGRGTIREALRILSQKGLTETKRGACGGTFVIEPSTSLLQDNILFLLLRSKLSYTHLLEFRSYTDEAILQLVVMKHTEETISPLMEKALLLQTIAHSHEPDIKEVLSLDSELNIMLAQLTDNPLFIYILEVVQTQLGTLDDFLFLHPEYMRNIADNWVRYIKAITQRDLKEAQYRLSYHYELLAICLEEYKEENDVSFKNNTVKTEN